MVAELDQFDQYSREGIPQSLVIAAYEQAAAIIISPERLTYPRVPGITIDPEGCRDRDDAVFVKQLPDGKYQALITIASVGEFVPEETPLDTLIRLKGFTVYDKSRVKDAMLPEELSQGKLSLLAGELRPTLTIAATLSQNAEIEIVEIKRTCFQSPEDFSYNDALKILLNPSRPYSSMLQVAAELAEKLAEKRTGRKARKDRNYGINTVHEIIGELMILANYAIAQYALRHDLPVIFRNYPDRYDDCPEKLQRGGAYYSPVNRGHKELCLESYNRGTSSLRRWDDVHNTRLLSQSLDGEIPTISQEALSNAAQRLTIIERDAKRRDKGK